jgi:2-polyprenyl-6-methoxyphenol hydroxylase-like FAD-dependent oxidoreductase
MMVSFPQEAFEVIIIGGGIAGNALAAVLARAGRAVLVLERSTVYRDRVRGEVFQPWGVAEARRLDLHEALVRGAEATIAASCRTTKLRRQRRRRPQRSR